MSDLVWRPPAFHAPIYVGQHFHWELPPMVDAATGLPFDFTNDPEGTWTARMDIVEHDGTSVVLFATSGEDGVITLDEYGVVALDLTAAHTGTLDVPTTEYAGAGHGPRYGDVVLTDPADDEPWLFFRGTFDIVRTTT